MRLAILIDYAGTAAVRASRSVEITDVIRQQQDQSGVQLLALFLGEAAMGMEQRFVEVVRTSEMRFGDSVMTPPRPEPQAGRARQGGARTAFTSGYATSHSNAGLTE